MEHQLEELGRGGARAPWRDAALPPERRVADLLSRLTLEEKVAQLYGVWVGADASGEEVAPHHHDLTGLRITTTPTLIALWIRWSW